MNSKQSVGCVGADDRTGAVYGFTSIEATQHCQHCPTVPACKPVQYYITVRCGIVEFTVHCSQDCGNIKLCPAKADRIQRARM